jgi:hypothetical protein
MKLPSGNPSTSRECATGGFTLVEIMMVSGIFLIVVMAMVAVQVYGLRVYTLAATKLTATTGGREALSNMRDTIRGAKTVYVGIYSNSAFAVIPNGQQQIGNAIQIYTATNGSAANAVVFYMDTANTNMSELYNGAVNVLAPYMTNYYCFQAEDYTGNILTNYQNNPVIHLTMQFYQWEYPIGYIGSGALNAYDYYTLQTRIARRAKD